MMRKYSYVVEGIAAQDPEQTWTLHGIIEATDLLSALSEVTPRTFQALTRGEARFGQPQTCRGPYTFTRIEVRLSS